MKLAFLLQMLFEYVSSELARPATVPPFCDDFGYSATLLFQVPFLYVSTRRQRES